MKNLIKALDMGYRHRPDEMLQYFLTEILVLWGLPRWRQVPEDAKQRISDAIETYGEEIQRQSPFHDVLGPLYMELSSHGGRQMLGQFFTPWPIAQMMAQMLSPETKSDDGRLLTTCDPACGSGVMMLALASTVMKTHGPEALLNWSFLGCDLDPFCSRMMAVQMIANCNVHGVQMGELIVLRGNSLLVDEEKELIVHASAPKVAVAPAKHPARMEALAVVAQSQQLDLFEMA